jgi:tetratricopeptide (TPR) repeat protein
MPQGQQGRQAQQAAQQQAQLAQQQALQGQLAMLAHEQVQRRARVRRGLRVVAPPQPAATSVMSATGTSGRALVVMSGPRPYRQIPIPAAGLLLGRDDHLGPPLATDALVSRHHASVRLQGDGTVEVADLGSTNGTYINGSKVTTLASMGVGDVLRLGDVELQLQTAPVAYQETIAGSGRDPFAAADLQPEQEDLLARARDLYEQRRYEEAKLAFRQLAGIPGAAGEAHYGLGMICLSQGDPVPAEAEFKQAIELDPGQANALYEIGALRETAGDVNAAAAYYRRALAISPAHVSAQAALGRLGGESTGPVRPAEASYQVRGPAAPPALPIPPSLSGGNVPSVYQFLVEDPTPISQQTVQLIQRVECEARPRYVAYVGRYFTRTVGSTVILAVLLIAANIVVNMLQPHYSVIPTSSTISRISDALWVCIAALPVCVAIIGYISVLCTRIRIQKGRLQIEKGIFRKHLNNIDFWRVHNIDLDRRLVNRMTGDGTLVFSLTFGVLPENYERRRRRNKPDHVIEVRGLVHGAKLTELHQDLLNLTFLLRGNPIVKGIIQ